MAHERTKIFNLILYICTPLILFFEGSSNTMYYVTYSFLKHKMLNNDNFKAPCYISLSKFEK